MTWEKCVLVGASWEMFFWERYVVRTVIGEMRVLGDIYSEIVLSCEGCILGA